MCFVAGCVAAVLGLLQILLSLQNGSLRSSEWDLVIGRDQGQVAIDVLDASGHDSEISFRGFELAECLLCIGEFCQAGLKLLKDFLFTSPGRGGDACREVGKGSLRLSGEVTRALLVG